MKSSSKFQQEPNTHALQHFQTKFFHVGQVCKDSLVLEVIKNSFQGKINLNRPKTKIKIKKLWLT